jgi:hypothetical protein
VPDTFWACMPSPGVLTVVLALLAVVTAMPPLNRHIEKLPWFRNICAAIIFLVAAGEIFVIQHADRESTAHYNLLVAQSQQTLATVVNVQQSIVAIQLSVGDWRVATEKYNQAKAKAQPSKPPSLKLTALQLSRDIFEFLANSDKSAPVLSASAKTGSDLRDNYMQLVQHFQDANVEYERNFEPRISEVLARAEKEHLAIDIAGAKQGCLITGATNMFSMRNCAFEIQRIGEAAK